MRKERDRKDQDRKERRTRRPEGETLVSHRDRSDLHAWLFAYLLDLDLIFDDFDPTAFIFAMTAR